MLDVLGPPPSKRIRVDSSKYTEAVDTVLQKALEDKKGLVRDLKILEEESKCKDEQLKRLAHELAKWKNAHKESKRLLLPRFIKGAR